MPYSRNLDTSTNGRLLHHPRFHVRGSDLVLIAKKITVGVVITAIPLVVIGGGLALTRALLQSHHSAVKPAAQTTNQSPRR